VANETTAQRMEAERFKFPGLLPDEIIVMRAWLVLHQSEWQRFEYNVRLGPGTDPGPQFPPNIRQDGIRLSQLRIDAVAFRNIAPELTVGPDRSPAEIYAVSPGAIAEIIEVKRRALPGNIGQLTTYFHSWMHEFPNASPPTLRLVCNTYTPNIIPAIQQTGINLDRVDVIFTALRTPR
jgi:hypothetical protein